MGAETAAAVAVVDAATAVIAASADAAIVADIVAIDYVAAAAAAVVAASIVYVCVYIMWPSYGSRIAKRFSPRTWPHSYRKIACDFLIKCSQKHKQAQTSTKMHKKTRKRH